MRALATAAAGMMAQELNVQVISNNIANMRTTGYKRQRAEFQDLLYEHVRRIGTQTSTQGNILPVGIDLGGGAHASPLRLCAPVPPRRSERLGNGPATFIAAPSDRLRRAGRRRSGSARS